MSKRGVESGVDRLARTGQVAAPVSVVEEMLKEIFEPAGGPKEWTPLDDVCAVLTDEHGGFYYFSPITVSRAVGRLLGPRGASLYSMARRGRVKYMPIKQKRTMEP